MGHTAAGYDECIEGIEWGMRHATHFYNAMTPLKHREPGAVGAFGEGRIQPLSSLLILSMFIRQP